MRMLESGTGIRSLDEGFEILLPDHAARAERVRVALELFGIDRHNVVRVQQVDRDSRHLDAEDRVQLGVRLTRAIRSDERVGGGAGSRSSR